MANNSNPMTTEPKASTAQNAMHTPARGNEVTTHSPLPWVQDGTWVGVGAGTLARCYATQNYRSDGPQAEANAAFIVRACNSHAALVAALEWFVNRFADYEDIGPSGESWQSAAFAQSIADARAALEEARK